MGGVPYWAPGCGPNGGIPCMNTCHLIYLNRPKRIWNCCVFTQLHQSRIWWYVIMINDDRKKTESQGADKTARITVAIIDMLLRTIVLFLFSSTEYLNKCYQSLNVWRVKIHYANYFESEVGSLCRHKYLHFRLGTIEWHKSTTYAESEWHEYYI